MSSPEANQHDPEMAAPTEVPTEVFVPAEEDEDPEATRQMQEDAREVLYDPWFSDAQAAQTWEGVSEFAEPEAGS